MISVKLRSNLHQYMLALSILAIALFGQPVNADDEFTPDHLRSDRSVWNSGALDARGGNPTGFDGSADYILEYTEERDRIRQEELLEAIEEARDE